MLIISKNHPLLIQGFKLYILNIFQTINNKKINKDKKLVSFHVFVGTLGYG